MLVFECLASYTELCIVIVAYHFNRGNVHFILIFNFSNINILYTVLTVTWLYESVYRQAQATLPTLVVNKRNHVCTFCLYGLKDCKFNFYLIIFHGLISLVLVKRLIVVWAKETQMLAILLSRGPF